MSFHETEDHKQGKKGSAKGLSQMKKRTFEWNICQGKTYISLDNELINKLGGQKDGPHVVFWSSLIWKTSSCLLDIDDDDDDHVHVKTLYFILFF